MGHLVCLFKGINEKGMERMILRSGLTKTSLVSICNAFENYLEHFTKTPSLLEYWSSGFENSYFELLFPLEIQQFLYGYQAVTIGI